MNVNSIVVNTFLGILLTTSGWLLRRLVGSIDSLEECTAKHAIEIRDTRSAIARIEGHLELDPFQFQN